MIWLRHPALSNNIKMHSKNLIVETLQPADIPEVAGVISKAMVHNPTTFALWGAQGQCQQRMIENMVRNLDLGRPHSFAFVARLDGRIVAGVNMVAWPHCKTSLIEGVKQLPILLPSIRGAMLRYLWLHVTLTRHHPERPHLHLGPIGVLPEMQGLGIGNEFVNSYLSVIDKGNQAAYLETSLENIIRNHIRKGFEVIRLVNVLGLRYWLMWRPSSQSPVD